MKLKEFVKMFNSCSLTKEENISSFSGEKIYDPDAVLGKLGSEDEFDSLATGATPKVPDPNSKIKCFSNKGHKLSFQEASYMLYSYARNKNLVSTPVSELGTRCTEDFLNIIKAVQADLNFPPDQQDGIIGKNTIKALQKASSKPSDKKKETPTVPAGAITIVGDSIATGMIVAYANKGLGYPECKGKNYFSCKLPMAQGGKHTFQILSMMRSNLSKDKQGKNPGTMLVSAGTNDALAYSADRGNFTPENTLSKIDQINQFATAAGYKVKFKTIDPIRQSKVYNQEKYNEFAQKVNNTLTSKYETFSGSKIPLQDLVHPTRQGYSDLLDIAIGEKTSAPAPKPVQPVKQKDIEDTSRPGGNAKYVNFIEQNLEIVKRFCQDALGIEFSFTADGLKNFQKAAGFAGETRTFDMIIKTKKGKKKVSRTIEGQIDGKIGPHTMTALTLLYFINQSKPKLVATSGLNPNNMFESTSLSLKERLENNLQKLNERTDVTSFEQFANTKYFKSRVANTHSIMKLQNPSIPSFNQINLPFDNQALLEERYEIYKGIGISRKYSESKRNIIKLCIDAILDNMPSDAHSKQAIIALLSVCGKESGFIPKMAESAGYRFSKVKANKKGDSVPNRVWYRFLEDPAGPGRAPTDKEIKAITGGGRNGPALFNIAYGYSKYHKGAQYTSRDKVIVNGEINPKLYNPNGAGYKYRGHGMVQITFKGNYDELERLSIKKGGKLAQMFRGVSNDPSIILKTPEHNVIASIMYMNFQHAKNAIKRAKQKEGETEMEFLVRKYASGPFGSTIHQKLYSKKYKKMVEPSANMKINGQINLSAASNKTAGFIIVDEE